MGTIETEIEIINGDDLVLARRHIIGEEEIRKMTVRALVDTSALNMCINENIQGYMNFPTDEYRKFFLANGEEKELLVVSNVKIIFRHKSTVCRAVVLPGSSSVLLGAIPLEDLDIVINSRKQQIDIGQDSSDLASLRLYHHKSADKIHLG